MNALWSTENGTIFRSPSPTNFVPSKPSERAKLIGLFVEVSGVTDEVDLNSFMRCKVLTLKLPDDDTKRE